MNKLRKDVEEVEELVSFNSDNATVDIAYLLKLLTKIKLSLEEVESNDGSQPFNEEIIQLQQRFKKACSNSINITLGRQKEIKDLLLSKSEANLDEEETDEKSAMISKSKEVTASLERMRNNLMKDLDRMSKAEKVLKRDKEILRQTVEKHDDFSAEASIGSGLITSIDRKQRKTKILADIGFFIFCLALIYIASKRIPGFVFEYLATLFYAGTELVNSMFFQR